MITLNNFELSEMITKAKNIFENKENHTDLELYQNKIIKELQSRLKEISVRGY